MATDKPNENELRRHILTGGGDRAALDFRVEQLQNEVTALRGFLEIAMKTTAEMNQFRSRLDNIERDIAALKALLPGK